MSNANIRNILYNFEDIPYKLLKGELNYGTDRAQKQGANRASEG